MKDENTARELDAQQEDKQRQLVLLDWEDGDEETNDASPSEKPSQLARLRHLPRSSDPAQRRAGRRILWFLVLVLVFTIVARGTAGATMPRVDIANPAKGEVVEKATGQANVKARGSIDVDAPEGLTPTDILVDSGAKVEAGDALARYDPEDVREALAREVAALEGLRAKLSALERSDPHDATALESAQRSLARAQEDYSRTVAEGDTAIANAHAAVAQAQAALDNAAAEERAEAQKALDEANAALTAAQATRDDNVRAAARAVEDAKTGLASAQLSDAQARSQAADTAAQNAADAATQRLDIAKQEKKVAALQALADANGTLTSPQAGTITQVADGTATEGPLVKLASGEGGYEAEVLLDKKAAEGIEAGSECEVTTGGGAMYYNPTVTAQVASRGDPDEDGRVKLTLRLPEGEWKQGQQVDVQFIKSQKEYALCVPLSALHSDNSGYYLLTLEKQTTVLGVQDKAVRVPVTLLAQDGKTAAVEGPLSTADTVVSGSNKPVDAGSKVRVNDSE